MLEYWKKLHASESEQDQKALPKKWIKVDKDRQLDYELVRANSGGVYLVEEAIIERANRLPISLLTNT